MVLSISKFLLRLVQAVRSQTQRVWLVLAIVVLLVSILGVSFRLQQTAIAAPSMPKVATESSPQVPVNLPATTQATAPTPTPSAPAALPQNCVPNATYSLPAPLGIASQAAGLTQVIDAPMYYQVYGNTSSQIRTQLQTCAPGNAAFAAETGYNLLWQYDSNAAGNGSCSISNVKVALHINMILPQWSPTDSADSGLAGVWQKTVSNLVIHESGHVSIDQQFAAQLLNDLKTLPAMDCGSLTVHIKAKAEAVVAELNAANDAYDARTDHGVTQGAFLPSE